MVRFARWFGGAVALGAMASVGLGSGPLMAAGAEPHIDKLSWTFAGPFGGYDQAQLQRGFRVYRDACAFCHSLEYVPFRALGSEHGPGFSEAAVVQIASEYQITDGPDEAGDMFERPGRPSDYFPSPFANQAAAKAANNGAYPPDLSLIAKARAAHAGFPWFVLDALAQYQEAGPDYIYALLNSYQDPPACAEGAGNYYNAAFLGGSLPAECNDDGEPQFPGGFIAMPPPISDGQIEYTDGSPETVEQYSKDVAAFLMWAAEPKLEERKAMGFRVMIFLIVFAVLLYLTKRKIWRNLAH
jgi:ubiquinol-cytochrome c reductase cytochrome b/c1 subunit